LAVGGELLWENLPGEVIERRRKGQGGARVEKNELKGMKMDEEMVGRHAMGERRRGGETKGA